MLVRRVLTVLGLAVLGYLAYTGIHEALSVAGEARGCCRYDGDLVRLAQIFSGLSAALALMALGAIYARHRRWLPPWSASAVVWILSGFSAAGWFVASSADIALHV
jgi:hypothetical protein